MSIGTCLIITNKQNFNDFWYANLFLICNIWSFKSFYQISLWMPTNFAQFSITKFLKQFSLNHYYHLRMLILKQIHKLTTNTLFIRLISNHNSKYTSLNCRQKKIWKVDDCKLQSGLYASFCGLSAFFERHAYISTNI